MRISKQYLKLAEQHYQWLVSKGWNKANPLESLALITSEVGEAMMEVSNGTQLSQNQKLGFELADIVLRIMGVLKQHNISLNTIHFTQGNTTSLPTKEEVLLTLGTFVVEIGIAVNACRKVEIDPLFYSQLIKLWDMTEWLAQQCGENLIHFVQIKIEHNLKNTSNHRII